MPTALQICTSDSFLLSFLCFPLFSMPSFSITGGNPLHGDVIISGSKNAVGVMTLAALLTEETVILENVPLNQEADIARELVKTVGGEVEVRDHTFYISVPRISQTSELALTRKNRLAILALAPLLHRAREGSVPLVGGDRLGPRPVNFHVDALRSMGAEVREDENGFHATTSDRLQGAIIELPYPSVGATQTILFAAVLAKGRTVIRNAALEPEITELVMMLQKMGAIIELKAGRYLEILGVERLHGCTHRLLPDRLEVASYGALALSTRGEIFCRGAEHRDVVTFLNAVRRVGGEYEVEQEGIRFRGASLYRGLQIETDTHPGFVTDWQQPFVAVLTQAEGTSVVHETVYQDRFGYTEALVRMGADITLFDACLGEISCRFKGQNYKHSAVINGPTPLHATDLLIPDIRAGLAYVIAALVAEGTSTLTGIEHLDRGYEGLEEKLRGLGAKIERSE